MATIDDVYNEVQSIKSYFNVDEGVNNTQDNVNSINSFIVMFFRIFLHILYQSLCYVSHLSRNFSERADYYNLNSNSLKLHVDVNFSTSNYVTWFTSGFTSEFFIAEIISCTSSDNFIGGRILTDTCNFNSQNGLLEFRFEFEVFCPFLNVSDFASDFFSGISSDIKKSILELLLKNLFLLKSVSFKQDANLKQLHSKSFLKFLTGKLKDNFSSFVEQLGLSEFVSNAQTELELPSSSNTALTLYTGGVASLDWLTDLLNLFIDFINSLADYSQTSKIDRLLECEFDAKKFNRLLGDALNYATGGEVDPDNSDRLKEPVVERNDQTYVDLNPDGQISLDWDGGLPASVSHRHYNFKKFLCFLRDNDGNKFFTSEEFKRLFKQVFIPGEEV